MPGIEGNLADASTDQELIRACLDGESAAWERLVSRYSRLIYAVPLRYALGEPDASDVFQRVCLRLYAKLETLRDEHRLAQWLITIAARESLNTLRSRQPSEGERRASSEDDANALQIVDVANDVELQRLEDRQIIDQAMARLPERDRCILRLLYFDPSQPSYEDIAHRLGIAVHSVGSYRARALQRLRKLMEDGGFRVR